jgi:hypothetical protein
MPRAVKYMVVAVAVKWSDVVFSAEAGDAEVVVRCTVIARRTWCSRIGASSARMPTRLNAGAADEYPLRP